MKNNNERKLLTIYFANVYEETTSWEQILMDTNEYHMKMGKGALFLLRAQSK